MSFSEPFGSGLATRALLLASVAAASAGCDDPAAVRTPPVSDRLQVLMVLYPDSATQVAFITSMGVTDTIRGIRAELSADGVPVAVATKKSTGARDWACSRRYGALLWTAEPTIVKPICLVFDLQPVPGTEYRLTITADDRPSASAVSTVPGNFSILTASASGDPTGTEGLTGAWTGSEAAYRYLIALRADHHPRCVFDNCEDGLGGRVNYGWFDTTADTAITTRVPTEAVSGGTGNWHVDVYATDQALHNFLTSGTTDVTFPVPPAQNIVGGYGIFGSWNRRTYTLPPG